ncbi:MAG: tyrosine-type recombinase/integrase [Kosmotogaceae bacterium]
MSKINFWGIYAQYIRQFIKLKRDLGYKYLEEEYVYRRFDQFTIERGETEVGISKELADKWCERRNNESDTCRYHRCVCISQLSSYLCKLGIRSYIPRLPRIKSTFSPYIYSKKEIETIFNAADSLITPKKVMNSIIFIVPTLIRLLYGTGLRLGEALSLLNKDVNLSENYILVKDSKSGKQRLIPISESLSAVCQDYINYRRKLPVLQSDDCPFFISLNGSACLQPAVYRYFRIVLKAAGIPYIGKGQGPRIHDIRHTSACHALAKMAESGVDLYTSLPILSTYLGHQTLNSTNKYVRLTAAMYPGLLKDVDMICLNVFPNIENYETD